MLIHRGLIFGIIGAALTAGVVTSAFVGAEATPTAATSCYGPCLSETVLSLSRAEVSYGHEQVEMFKVTVRPRDLATGTLTGTVTVKTQDMTLCTITLLDSRKGSCSLTVTELLPGYYRVMADFGGDSSVRGSRSASRYFEVKRGSFGRGFGRGFGHRRL